MFFKEKKICRELTVLLENKKYDEVISQIEELYGGGFGGAGIPLRIKKILALAYYYKGDFDNAQWIFISVASKEENTQNLFNLMMTYMSLGKVDLATLMFSKICSTHRGFKSTGKGKNFLPQLCIPYIRYYYANGLADAERFYQAMAQLEKLKDLYIEMKITDATFLYLRGVPDFGSFIELCKRTFDGLNRKFENSMFLKELINAVDDEGKEIINNILKAD